MSQRIFNLNSIAKDIHSLLSPDQTSGIYILQAQNHCWATVCVMFTVCMVVHLFFWATLYICYS